MGLIGIDTHTYIHTYIYIYIYTHGYIFHSLNLVVRYANVEHMAGVVSDSQCYNNSNSSNINSSNSSSSGGSYVAYNICMITMRLTQ